MNLDRVLVIIPAYNEELSLSSLLPGLKSFSLSRNVDLLVVDDASDDGTSDICNEMSVPCLRLCKNKGYEGAINAAFVNSARHYDIVITFDADGEHRIEDLDAMISKISMSDTSLVIGSRSCFNRLSEIICGRLFNFFFDLRDPLSGFKGYRMSYFKDMEFDRNKMVGTYLLWFAIKSNYSICEVPIKVERRNGISRFGIGLKTELLIFYKVLVIGALS